MNTELNKNGHSPQLQEPIIATSGLMRHYGEVKAVNGVDLSVAAGEIFGLLGPNGAGKTTTIKMLVTLIPPTSGQASVCGHDIKSQASAVRRSIGYVPQALSADGTLTGWENLEVMARLYDVPRREERERITDVLNMMDLTDAAQRLVRTYSGGMIRRLEIAQSLVHRPQVLFLDEPTVGLDPVARRAVWEHLSDLRDQYGTTLFITTHYMEEADELAGRVAIMHKGKIVALDTPDALKAQIGKPGATLEDAFAYFTGDSIEEGGSYKNVKSSRRTASRLG